MPETRLVPDERRQHSIAAVATFTAFIHAYERGELAAATEAQAELARLGVVVRFARPKAHDQNGGHHA